MAGSKEQIIDAAKTLFGEHGYDGAAVRDIAELAKTNAASISYYFGSKEELFKHIAKDCLKETDRIIGVLREIPESSDEFKLIIKSFLKLFCTIRAEDPRSFFFINRNMDLLLELDPETFEKSIWQLKVELRELVKKAKKKKILRSDLDADAFAFTVFSSISHLIRDENVSCKFAGVSVFDESYRNKYINQTVNCLIDGAKEKV